MLGGLFTRPTAFVSFLVLGGLGFCETAGASLIAVPTTLDQVVAPNGGNWLVVGDKKFSEFSYTAAGSAPAAIDVDIAAAPGPVYGLEFSYGWNASPGGSMTSTICYRIDVMTPGLYIDKVDLLFNGFGLSGGTATVTESVWTDSTMTSSLGTLSVGVNASSSLDLIPDRTSIFVCKQIEVVGGAGYATISLVDNTYPQVPEPALIGWVLAATPLALIRRRRPV